MSPIGIAALSLGIAALAIIYDRTRDRPPHADAGRASTAPTDATETPRPNPWRLTRKTGLVYQLTNIGSEPAAAVNVLSNDPAITLRLRNAPWLSIAKGESAEFVLTAPIGDVPPVVAIVWTTTTAEPDAVELALPVDDTPAVLAEPMLEFDPPQQASAWFEPYSEAPSAEIRIPSSGSGDGVGDDDGATDGDNGSGVRGRRQPARHASR